MLLILLFFIILLLLFIYFQNPFIIERHSSGGKTPGSGISVGYHSRVARPGWGGTGYTSNWGGWGELPHGSYSDIQINCSKECIQNNNCNCDCKSVNGIYKCF